MGVKKLIGKKDSGKGGVPDKVKIKPCRECPRFKFFQNIDFDKDYHRSPATLGREPLGSILFVMSPRDFDALERKQWKHVICSELADFDVSFVPYPRCYENAYADEKMSIHIWRGCREHAVGRMIEAMSPELIIVFDDTKNVLSLDGGPEIPHPGNWAKWRGRTAYLAKGLWHPRGFDLEGFKHTSSRIRKFFDGKLFWQSHPNFKKILTSEDLVAVREEVFQQSAVAIDFETTGLDVLEEGFRLKTIALAWPGKAVCIGFEVPECPDIKYRAQVLAFLEELFEHPKIRKVAWNLKYEMKVALVKGLSEFNACEDGMFMAYLLDENRRSNGLKFLAGAYLDGYPKLVDDFANAPYEDLWFYNCLDAAYTFRLWAVDLELEQLGELAPGAQFVYEHVMLPLCRELALMEVRGVKIDYAYTTRLQTVISEEVQELLETIQRDYPQMGQDLKKLKEILNSPKQLADVLFSMLRFPIIKPTKTGASTDKETLVTLKEKHGCKLAEYILAVRKKEKVLSTYVTPYIEKRSLYRLDRVRCSYGQVKNFGAQRGEAKGTVTGRLSSAGPNLQNIPRDKKVKKMYVPSAPGRVLLQADLSQAELRIGASLAFEEKMLSVYDADGDIHETTGLSCSPPSFIARYNALPEGSDKKAEFKKIRQNGKSINFANLYIGSHLVLMRVAKQSYGVDFSEPEALTAYNAYHDMYPGIRTWHESVEAYIRKYWCTVSPYGRIRRAPKLAVIEDGSSEYSATIRELLNSTVQGSCADFLGQAWTTAGVEIRRRGLDRWLVDFSLPIYPVLTVHDNVVFDALNKDVAEEVASILAQSCAKWSDYHREAGWLRCAMKMDFEIGEHWGALEEVDVEVDEVEELAE